jgi:hypothetical protein
VAGHYQNPFTIASNIENGVMTSIDPVFYAYMVANLILWGLGAFFQFKQKNKGGHKNEDPYHRYK